MQSKAPTVAQYLKELPAERRAVVAAVRKVVLANLDDEFGEGMGYGMISWHVPHRVYPHGYHCDPKMPLPFGGLAAGKSGYSLYLMSVYFDPSEERRIREGFAAAKKKLDMGKSCIRFKRLEDLPLDVIGAAVARVKAQDYIARYEKNLGPRARPKSPKSTTRPVKKAARKA